MKEEYVTYEQAVKLKELGFDWECNHFNPDCSAIRLDQAQRWLREKHNLSVEPICNMVRQWNVNVCEIDNFGTAVYSKMNLDTYELALSAGIDKALELLTLNPK